MRTIDNIGDGKVIETIVLFDSEEERADFYSLSLEGLNRSHRQALADLRLAYSADLQTDPEGADSHRLEYLENVKKQYEEYHRSFSLLNKQIEKSILETDVKSYPYPYL